MTAFFLGTLGGGRTFLITALVAWAARLAALPINDSVGWLLSTPAIGIFTLLAAAELAYDKSPGAKSRKRPPALVARMLLSALVGFAVTPGTSGLAAGLGAAGAFIGTYALSSLRVGLGTAFGRDLPAALTEDALIIAASLALLVY